LRSIARHSFVGGDGDTSTRFIEFTWINEQKLFSDCAKTYLKNDEK
jgi:hypothetical protein